MPPPSVTKDELRDQIEVLRSELDRFTTSRNDLTSQLLHLVHQLQAGVISISDLQRELSDNVPTTPTRTQPHDLQQAVALLETDARAFPATVVSFMNERYNAEIEPILRLNFADVIDRHIDDGDEARLVVALLMTEASTLIEVNESDVRHLSMELVRPVGDLLSGVVAELAKLGEGEH